MRKLPSLNFSHGVKSSVVTRSVIAGIPTMPNGPNMLTSRVASEMIRAPWRVWRTPLVPAKSSR